MDKAVKIAEIENDAENAGNKKLIEKFKYDESPWIAKVFKQVVGTVTGEGAY